ncbi:PglL family O-oligosaccharyltransferase [Colwellia sp. E2M01]|uniref:PglL family O-oligosaccharyltransferase n=1 Tax=Colwellia sp. E2M01 TaxID=2841561 RepID=UPI001C09FFBC|nr:PglL family O-oligosaccharyltransferase [Colwellia sp. E2M01]MBU2870303.1 PglL family O-oligosaccharyltransferase [Colwellia sp. E2M01]
MILLPYFKFFLVLYFLVGMHVILDTPGGVGLYYSYNVIAWIITSILIALGLWQITLNKKIYYSNMLLWLTLGCICLVIPIFYNFQFTDHAIPRVLALIGGLLFLFSLYQFQLSKPNILQILGIILIAIILEASFGLVQFFIFEAGDWGGYRIGSSRPHGVFLQPNVMASFMATGLAIALFFSSKTTLLTKYKPLKYFVFFSLFSTTFLLVVLQSRTGFVGALLALICTTPYIFQKSKRQLVTNLCVIGLAISAALICIEKSSTPVRSTEVYQNTGVRYDVYLVSLNMIKEEPLLGYGYGGFERSFIDHFNQYAQQHPEVGDTLVNFSHPHNEVFFWVVEGGGVALLAFLLFTVGFVLTWIKIPLNKGLLLLALPLPLLVHCQFEFPFYSSVSHWLVFLILLWVIDQYTINTKNKINIIPCQKTFLIRFLALLIPAIFVPFMVTAQHTAYILVEYEKNLTDPVALKRLNNIVNPIAWQNRLDAAVYAHILISGLHERDNEKLTSYLDWVIDRIQYKPRPILYRKALLVANILDKEELFDRLLNEAQRTYPQEKTRWLIDLEKHEVQVKQNNTTTK